MKRAFRFHYRCNACRKVVTRNSTKWWIPSYCESTGKNARLYRVAALEDGKP